MRLTLVFFGLVLLAITFVDCMTADSYTQARKAVLKKYEAKNVNSKTVYAKPPTPTAKVYTHHSAKVYTHPTAKVYTHPVVKPRYAEKKIETYKPIKVAVEKDPKPSRYQVYQNRVQKAVGKKNKPKYEVKKPRILDKVYKEKNYKHDYGVAPHKKSIKNKSKEYKKKAYEVKKYKKKNKEHKDGYEAIEKKGKKGKNRNKKYNHEVKKQKKNKKKKNKEYKKAYGKKEKKDKYHKDALNNRANAGKQYGFHKKAL